MKELFGEATIEDYKVQGSEAWLKWRSKHIGASEVPAIMGTCDFSNIYEKWLDKTGLVQKVVDNFATRRGTAFEPQIRAEVEERFNVTLTQDVVEDSVWPVLSASLDGVFHNEDGYKVIVEIKYPSKEKHNLALSGIVPETYRDQVQAQLLVTKAQYAYYVSFDPEGDKDTRLAIVKVEPDFKRQDEILEACQNFWINVLEQTPPEGMAIQDELEAELEVLDKYKSEIKALEALIEGIETSVKEKMKASRVMAGPYTLSWVERKGNVDYKAIKELQDVDLEKYRKSSSRYLKISKSKT